MLTNKNDCIFELWIHHSKMLTNKNDCIFDHQQQQHQQQQQHHYKMPTNKNDGIFELRLHFGSKIDEGKECLLPQQYPPGLQLPKAGFNVGPDRTQQDQPSLEHFVSLGQTGSERLPWLATLRHRWLPRASFNVVSAASGGRWGFCGCHCSRT